VNLEDILDDAKMAIIDQKPGFEITLEKEV